MRVLRKKTCVGPTLDIATRGRKWVAQGAGAAPAARIIHRHMLAPLLLASAGARGAPADAGTCCRRAGTRDIQASAYQHAHGTRRPRAPATVHTPALPDPLLPVPDTPSPAGGCPARYSGVRATQRTGAHTAPGDRAPPAQDQNVAVCASQRSGAHTTREIARPRCCAPTTPWATRHGKLHSTTFKGGGARARNGVKRRYRWDWTLGITRKVGKSSKTVCRSLRVKQVKAAWRGASLASATWYEESEYELPRSLKFLMGDVSRPRKLGSKPFSRRPRIWIDVRRPEFSHPFYCNSKLMDRHVGDGSAFPWRSNSNSEAVRTRLYSTPKDTSNRLHVKKAQNHGGQKSRTAENGVDEDEESFIPIGNTSAEVREYAPNQHKTFLPDKVLRSFYTPRDIQRVLTRQKVLYFHSESFGFQELGKSGGSKITVSGNGVEEDKEKVIKVQD
ncbi:hypothetical protein B0H16DRAFT_1786059 [Mycena metata]|uniref:Uncharacterized protein n=1 Tax=Mycena metata TaxID=1033252 RepID=A0AAD7HNQ8_9AGAR|nr:hypothetical protein B0H16DRAFT_1786059 [Mycena metata]